MDERYTISENDTVNVYFNTYALFDMLVLGTPAATGDSWKLIRHGTDDVIYVQTFEYMERTNQR